MKLKLFIGSSTEGRDIAYAIQSNLKNDFECTVWDQNVFELSSSYIETLVKRLDNTDFAVFVFSPDDEIKIRGNETMAARDNVLFELGLFTGKLGRDRAFFAIPGGSGIRIASDLLGVSKGEYEVGRDDGNHQAATGDFCNKVRGQAKKIGAIEKKETTTSSVINVESKVAAENIDSCKMSEVYSVLKILGVIYEKTRDELMNYDFALELVASLLVEKPSVISLKISKIESSGYISIVKCPTQDGPVKCLRLTKSAIEYLSNNIELLS